MQKVIKVRASFQVSGLHSIIRKNYGNKENIKQNIQSENIENKTKNT